MQISNRIQKGIMFFLLSLIGFTSLAAENKYPIVLIHGFIGWGPEEMGRYRYWGGSNDVVAYLDSLGYEIIVVSVGPVSSNWERAIEAYYQIKGGQVDYGQAHAEKWGVIRKPEGKVYKGLYPHWDARHPVHIIGHSMGGQTARMLQYQLSRIFYADSLGIIAEESELLGEAHDGWIKSITTIATPHNGTTLSDIVTKSVPFLQNFIALAAVVGTDFYDFDLQHWGFERREGESWISYYRRMREHPAWNTKNVSAWDLSLEGARQLNTELTADPEVYYFSFATSATHLDTTSGKHLPDEGMNLILRAKARLMGSKVAYWADGTATDSTWLENDGVVNTVSQFGPTTGRNGPDPIARFKPGEPLITGQWYTRGPIRQDHWKIIGQGVDDEEGKQRLYKMFADHCKLLWQLPK